MDLLVYFNIVCASHTTFEPCVVPRGMNLPYRMSTLGGHAVSDRQTFMKTAHMFGWCQWDYQWSVTSCTLASVIPMTSLMYCYYRNQIVCFMILIMCGLFPTQVTSSWHVCYDTQFFILGTLYVQSTSLVH